MHVVFKEPFDVQETFCLKIKKEAGRVKQKERDGGKEKKIVLSCLFLCLRMDGEINMNAKFCTKMLKLPIKLQTSGMYYFILL